MKKYIVLLTMFIALYMPKAYASSIVYNLEIDNEMEFHERIVYTIDDNSINNNNKYSFLSSVLNDRVYFDTNNKVPYTKTKQRTSTGYIVTLKHDYTNLFFIKSRIATECFNDIQLYNDANGLKFTSSSPFFCSQRADNITINITSAQKVTKSNADNVSGQTYTWNNIDKNFEMNFSTRPIEVSESPMDDSNHKTDDNSKNEPNTKKSSISHLAKKIIIGSSITLIVLIIITALVLKRKKEELDKF